MVYGASGAVYYAASDGDTAIFGKDDKEGERVWIKAYKNHMFRSNSFVVSEEKEVIFTIEEEQHDYLQILKINSTDGGLIMQYRR